ncbi:MAG: mandelate racemase, partial [Chloroflexota bacterium]
CHLAAGLPNFSYVEWDEAVVPGLEPLGYQLDHGMVNVPESPGFGLALDDSTFERALADNGFRVSM